MKKQVERGQELYFLLPCKWEWRWLNQKVACTPLWWGSGAIGRLLPDSQDKKMYFLDDILSAVDVHVARHIFQKCVRGLLRSKVCVLSAPTFSTCCPLTTSLFWRMAVYSSKPNVVLADYDDYLLLENADGSALTSGKGKEPGSDPTVEDCDPALSGLVGKDTVLEEEGRETGTISIGVVASYWRAVGHLLAIAIFLSMSSMQVTRNFTDWWLSYWVSNVQNSSNTTNVSQLLYSMPAMDDRTRYYLTVYGALAGLNSLFTLLRAFLFAYGGLYAAAGIHNLLLKSIVNAKVLFFDTSPLGRILNRFSSDTYTIDDSLPFIMNILLAQLFSMLGTLAVVMYGLPWMVLVLAPLVPVYQWLQNHYRLTSRELKRLSSVSLSPVYSHFSETLAGLPTIRAFRATSSCFIILIFVFFNGVILVIIIVFVIVIIVAVIIVFVSVIIIIIFFVIVIVFFLYIIIVVVYFIGITIVIVFFFSVAVVLGFFVGGATVHFIICVVIIVVFFVGVAIIVVSFIVFIIFFFILGIVIFMFDFVFFLVFFVVFVFFIVVVFAVVIIHVQLAWQLKQCMLGHRFRRENEDHLEANQKCQYASQAAGQWLGLRLQFIGVAVITGIGFIAVLQHQFNVANPASICGCCRSLTVTAMLAAVGNCSSLLTSMLITAGGCRRLLSKVQGRQPRVAVDSLAPMVVASGWLLKSVGLLVAASGRAVEDVLVI
ncbi:hypothetical protein PR048_022761 [Dryococelus australis]|uniref:ABC transmembrane type-1 domain-containing protein n=1 Tax=Dryococelus australis TaxID=614101 RepID=A0ABQ9GS55_9NEOP|nr:hypothetical protein PR048_022761 [Dryococelus australis]